jgi:hypothetical protein
MRPAVVRPMSARVFMMEDEHGRLTQRVTWAEMEEVNEPEIMEMLAEMDVGEETVLGMDDRIKRVV